MLVRNLTRFYRGLFLTAAIMIVACTAAGDDETAPVASSNAAESQIQAAGCDNATGAATGPEPVEVDSGGGGKIVADYRFDDSLASSLGGAVDLTVAGEPSGFVDEQVLGVEHRVWAFDMGTSLALTPASSTFDDDEYAIEMVFRFDHLDGWRKIIDFNDTTEDCGVYNLDGQLALWPVAHAFGSTMEEGSYAHLVVTRDSEGNVLGYVNGAEQWAFKDTGELAVVDERDTLRFFSDDAVTPGETSGGAVSRIRLYDGSLRGEEVAALAAELGVEPLRPDEVFAGLEGRLEEETAADRFSGAVLVARDGETVFSGAYGLADREQGIANTTETRFRIGSMNKMFTAVAIMQLVEDGRVDLDTPIGEYLPDYPSQAVADGVTIHHLLTHTGGTGDIFGPQFDTHRLELQTHDDYLDLYGSRGVAFPPGSRFEYSNYGFVLLGAVIEAATGQTYYDYVDENVFAPAGMTASGSLPEDQAVPGRAVGYMRPMGGSGDWQPNTDTLPYRGTAAGGGYSTVEDLARFGGALLGHELLGPENTELLITGKVAVGVGSSYAYGFEDGRDRKGRGPVGHGGGAPGMNGDLRIYPESGFVVAALANLDPPAAGWITSYLHPGLPQD